MKNTGLKQRWVMCLGLAVWLAGQGAGWAAVEETTKKDFKVAEGGTLVVDLDRGSIEVAGGEGDQVQVEVWREASSEDLLKKFEVTVAQVENRVEVKGRAEKGLLNGGWGWGRQLKVKCTVKVPRAFNVDLKTAGGGVSVKELKGTAVANTSGGGLDFHKVDGSVKGRTSGGSIKVSECVAAVDVGTSGGSLHLEQIKGSVKGGTSGGSVKVSKVEGDCDVGTSGGSISVEDVTGKLEGSTSGGSVSAKYAEGPKAECMLKTSGGGVSLTVPEKAGFELDAATSGGGVSSDLPVEMLVKGEVPRGRLSGKVNGGGPKVVLRSSGGSIRVKKN